MKTIFILLASFFTSVSVSAQDYYSSGKLSEILEYNLHGYSILDTATGDLNSDKIKDLIMIYRFDKEDSTSDIINRPEPRPLLIYLGQKDGNMKLKSWNKNLVLCYDCGGIFGDPYSDVIISDGDFTVDFYGGSAWRWTKTITFKYSKSDLNWFLFEERNVSFHATEPENQTIDLKTTKDFGIISFEDFDIYKESK